MTKPLSERTHKAQVEHGYKVRGLTAAQIRASKCTQSKNRNAARRVSRRAEADERNEAYSQLSYKAKLHRPDVGGFAAKKERERLMKKNASVAAA